MIGRNRAEAGAADAPRRPGTVLAAFCIICVMGGAASGLATPPGAWYAGLAKPGWTPPSWVFGPVWTMLYLMIGVSGWLLWSNRRAPGGRAVLALFVIQLALNFAWTPVFFGLQAPGPAFAVIVLLLACIVTTIGFAWRMRRAAALLLMPYAAWVAFASALNFALWRMN